MSILAHGIDMVDCHRLSASVEKHGAKFLDRVFTPHEQKYCTARKIATQHYAGRFAVKEAVLKVLGTGWANGIAWTDIEVRNEPNGQPKVYLSNKCSEIAQQLGIGNILISISHIETHAIASAIGVSVED
ncbi:MAG: holo-ACP synthase [Phycisphaerae bacterium]|nr:holo-ACP synthase [Phycisphaerae bacterium]